MRALQSFKTSGATCATTKRNNSEDSSTQFSYFISVVGIPHSTISATHQKLQEFVVSVSVLDDLYYLLLLYLLTGFGVETLRESDKTEDPVIDERIILRWIFENWDVGVWAGSNWLRIGTGGGHL